MYRFIKKLKNMLFLPYKALYCKLHPVGYARSLGVKVGEGTNFYSPNRNMFSTEPWLIEIGKNTHITAEVLFLTHDGGTLILDKKEIGDFILTGRIKVGDNTYIGTRTIVLPGVQIGENCIIGAGSIVTKSIPDNSVAVGVPAKVIDTNENYLEKIKNTMEGNNPRYFKSLDSVRSLNPYRKISK